VWAVGHVCGRSGRGVGSGPCLWAEWKGCGQWALLVGWGDGVCMAALVGVGGAGLLHGAKA
jgi:hypothetical protein